MKALLQPVNLDRAALGYAPSAMQTMKLDVEKSSGSNNERTVVKLRGKLALETVNEFITAFRTEPAIHLILDMSGVSFLDSAGVGALVSLFVSRRNAGKSFALAGLTQQGTAVLQVSGVLKLLPSYLSVEEAVAAHA